MAVRTLRIWLYSQMRKAQPETPMPHDNFRSLPPGGRPTAAEDNALADALADLSRIHGTEAGISLNAGRSGYLLELPPNICPGFWIKITGAVSGTKYPWTEQYWTGTAFVDGVRTGTTSVLSAYEANGSTTVATNTIVWAWPSVDGLSMEFEYAAASSFSLTVKAFDGTPSYSGITSIECDELDGFSLSQPAANRVKLNITECSSGQRGIVSLSAQQMGNGDKTFMDAVLINSDAGTGSKLFVYKSSTATPAFEVTADGTARVNTTANTYTVEVGGSLRTSGSLVSDVGITAGTTLTAANVNATTKFQSNGVDGIDATISYTKSGGGPGTLTFNKGILTAET